MNIASEQSWFRLELDSRYAFTPNINLLEDMLEEGKAIRLRDNENRMLAILADSPHRIFSRKELQDFVWRSQGVEVDDSSLTQSIATLRKILGDSATNPHYIQTIPKRGYRFIADVKKQLYVTQSPTSLESANRAVDIFKDYSRKIINTKPKFTPLVAFLALVIFLISSVLLSKPG